MKQRELIKLFEAKGWTFHHHGKRHDFYTDGENFEQIPRHKDVNEMLAKALIRKHKL